MICIEDAMWFGPDGRAQVGTILSTEEGIRLLPHGKVVTNSVDVISNKDGIVLPGLIDPHTHLREPGQAYKEGITSGTRAALAGGVTTVLDMPNNRPPTSTHEQLEAKRALFKKKSRVDWGLHVQASAENQLLNTRNVASVKIYMARSSADSAVNTPARLREIFATYPRISVHAEDEERFPKNRRGPHHRVRPREAVRAALQKIEDCLEGLSRGDRPRVILCHIATADEVTWLKRMKARGFDIWGETAPHYAVFTQSAASREGGRLRVNPPIRRREDRAAVVRGIEDGTIDFIGSDHAPHSPAEKTSSQPPSGIAGIEWMAPWLFAFFDRERLNSTRLLDLAARNAARCYGLTVPAGVAEGGPMDLILLRRGSRRKVFTRARWNPYKHRPLGWTVAATVVRGELAFHEGTFPGEPRGREVYP